MVDRDLSKNLSQLLIRENDPSEFLKAAYQLLRAAKRKTSFASLARKMQFSSRSFVRQLFMGTRQPNLKNYQQIAIGLGLSQEATTYLGLLIEKRELNSNLSALVESRITEAERRLRLSVEKRVQRVRKKDPVPFDRWPFIYASLGHPNQGRTFDEVMEISGQNPRVCAEILDYLVKKDIVLFDKKRQRYFPKENLVDIGELGNSPVLKGLYKMISLEALRRVETDMDKESALFHSAVFSVREELLPQMTRDLQNLLSSYMARSEDSSGNQLALMCSGLIPLRNGK